MKMTTEEIIVKLKRDSKYFRYIKKELKEDLNFAKICVMIDPKLYFKFPINIQKDIELVQLILDNATAADLKFPYVDVFAQNENQRKQQLDLSKKCSYMRLYKDLSPDVSIPDNLNLNSIDLTSDVFSKLTLAFEDLTDKERIVIEAYYGLHYGNPMRSKVIAALMNTETYRIRHVKENGLKKLTNSLKDGEPKQYKLEK